MFRKPKQFHPGKDWVWYAPNTFDVYGKAEIGAVVAALEDGWLAPGKRAALFENKISKLYGKRYGLFVNSGSSANLIGIAALGLPKGGEIITPACTFSTTLNPILQLGYVPVFVDVGLGTFVMEPESIISAISKKTVAVMVPHLIGNFVDMPAIAKICRTYKIALIEDSCDTIGGTIKGNPSGAWSDVTTTSFYASHVITAGGGGGMVMMDRKELWESARIYRDWGRGISRHDEKIRSRLARYQIDGRPYDSAFVFVHQGYNMKAVEMQAAFGLAQLRNLRLFLARREHVFRELTDFFKDYEKFFILPKPLENARTNWLAYPLTIRPSAPFQRNQLVSYLEKNKIQTRPVFSGNILKHPGYQNIRHRKSGNLKNSNTILQNSFLIGCHHGLTSAMLHHMAEVFDQFLRKY